MAADEKLERTWDWTMLLCTYGIAAFGCLCTVFLLDQLRITRFKWRRNRLLMMSSLALGGTSLWAMHSMGMYSMIVRCPDGQSCEMGVRPWAAVVSYLLVLVFAQLGLRAATRDQYFAVTEKERIEILAETLQGHQLRFKACMIPSKALLAHLQYLLMGGVLTSMGVISMHYLATWALVINARVTYDYRIIFASVAVCIVLCTVGYWLCMRLLPWRPYLRGLRYLAALIIGLSVCIVHYCGLLSMTFHATDNPGHTIRNNNIGSISSISGAVGICLCALSLCDVINYLRTKSLDTRKEVDGLYKQLTALLKQPGIDTDPVRLATWMSNVCLFLDKHKGLDVVGLGTREACGAAIEERVRKPMASRKTVATRRGGFSATPTRRSPSPPPPRASPRPILAETSEVFTSVPARYRGEVPRVSSNPLMSPPARGSALNIWGHGAFLPNFHLASSQRRVVSSTPESSLARSSRFSSLLDYLGVEPSREPTLLGTERDLTAPESSEPDSAGSVDQEKGSSHVRRAQSAEDGDGDVAEKEVVQTTPRGTNCSASKVVPL